MGLFPIISGNLYTFPKKGLSIIVLGLYVSHMVSVAGCFVLFFVLVGVLFVHLLVLQPLENMKNTLSSQAMHG